MISFKSIKAGFELEKPAFFRSWLKNVVSSENEFRVGDIQYIFCDDNYLHQINQKFLAHNTFTDIITFPYTSDESTIISGDIYISIDRISENKEKYQSSFQRELSRVLVHGILHLMGYKDASIAEKEEMRKKEDYYLNLQPPKKS